MDRRGYLRVLGAGGALSLAGCTGAGERRGGVAAADIALTLATATTTYDSGLLGELHPGFQEAFGATVKVLVRGTGAALRTARDGDCDVVLVHARPLEDRFLPAGHGVNRRAVMANDFLVVGPPDDPAGAASSDPVAAFRAIATAEAPFLSRATARGHTSANNASGTQRVSTRRGRGTARRGRVWVPRSSPPGKRTGTP